MRVIIALVLASVIIFAGCTKSEDNPAAPAAQYLTIRSAVGDSSFTWNFAIRGDTTSEIDQAVLVNYTTTQAGNLHSVKIMFGNWDSDTSSLVYVNVKVHSANGTVPGTVLATKSLAPASILTNGTGQFRWTEVLFNDVSPAITLTNGQHFFVSVTPVFTDRSTTSRQACKFSITTSSLNQTAAAQFSMLELDGTYRALVSPEGDFAIAAVVQY